jgi:mRNA deadenylase 3'-5' endonuclease subunit Ccr4
MSFSVASYNVLADTYIRPEWYPHTPAAVLAPAHRRPALLQRLAHLQADVFCLQEVEPDLFKAAEAHLKPCGYEGWYAQKTGKTDGCATFVRRRSVAVRAVHTLHYADGGTQSDSGHVALILTLTDERWPLGVANTHLKWDRPSRPRASQWAYRQARQLLMEISRIDPQCPAWIICGDLNALPDSDVLRALCQAGFRDAYADQPFAATCNANRQAKRIDFLLHTDALASQPVPLPIIDGQTPLPSVQEPSDHLPILASFDWRSEDN